MKDRDFKGVWIPKDIWELDLPLNDRLYLCIYKSTNHNIQETDSIMSINLSKSSILKIKRRLENKGYIKFIKTPEQAKQFVLDNIDNGQTCDWCHRKNYVLQEHHFPISKSRGGKQTVKICPNCHAVYHWIYKESN